MNTNRRFIAVAELALIFPAALFLTAVVMRHVRPLQYEPAHAAQQIVTWYTARSWTLGVLLIGLPFVALATGCATLAGSRNRGSEIRADLATRIIVAATLSAGAVLLVVALHMLAN
jgi:hypothetical protein